MIDARTGAMDPPGGPRDGGFAARRAIVRWAWRLFRREWRQQALVLGLLTVAVVASILSATIAYNVAPAGGRADFGTASHFLWFDGGDSGQLRADLAQAEDWFGVTQSITYRNVTVPGAFDALEVRGQDPDGPYGGPMLALREGRYPEGVTEIAVTRRVVETLGLEIGRSLVIDGVERAVVGLVENPNDLRQQFALVDPNQEVRPDSVQILVQSEDNHVFGFRSPSMSARTSRGMTAQLGILAALGSLGTAAIGMVFVALIATASFVVLAQRRLRQLGMLAAVGATERNLGLVTLANGIFAGIVAALIGSALALAAWIASVPILEEPFGHRIDRFGVPWWLLISVNVLALFTAASAAWWPARAAARIPIVLALSGRPPRPSGTERSAVIAVALMVAGVAGLLIAPATTNPLLVTAATVASIIGILFLCPFLIHAAALPVGRLPLATRIALRDMVRYQSRSGAALAAVTLALLIAASITIAAAAAEHGADEGNLSDRQLMVRIGDPDAPVLPPDFSPFLPVLTAAEFDVRKDGVDGIAALLDEARVIPLDAAFDPALGVDPRFDAQSAATLAQYESGPRPGYRDLALLYVASPEMLQYYGVNLATLDAGTELLTTESGDLWLIGSPGKPPEVTNDLRLPPGYSSLPGSFITGAALLERGWETMPAGWLVDANAPLSSAQLAESRRMAADAGLTIEFRDGQEGLATLRTQATAAGMVVALGVIAMTVGLIRSEAGRDLRTLTATGATSSTRRAVMASAAGALAFLGVVIGIVGAYAILGAGYLGASSALNSVPFVHLSLLALGVPTAALLVGWAVAGGEPPALTRQPIE